jgi:hypothetical protein
MGLLPPDLRADLFLDMLVWYLTRGGCSRLIYRPRSLPSILDIIVQSQRIKGYRVLEFP